MIRTYALAVGALLAIPQWGQAATRGDVFGSALHFDGIDDYVWMTPNVSGASEGTVELWARADAASTPLWTGGNGHPGTLGDWTLLGTHGEANGVSFGIFTATWRWAQSGRSFSIGEWTHFAATWGADGQKLYINGELAGVRQTAIAMQPYTMDLIGASAWGVGFQGAIDEVRFWSTAREQEEIQGAMNDIVDPALHPSLVAYYRFDALEDLGIGSDGADDLRDLTTNENHGDSEGEIQLASGALPVADQTWGRVKAYFR